MLTTQCDLNQGRRLRIGLELGKVLLGEHIERLFCRRKGGNGLVQLRLHLGCNGIGLLSLLADLGGLSINLSPRKQGINKKNV